MFINQIKFASKFIAVFGLMLIVLIGFSPLAHALYYVGGNGRGEASGVSVDCTLYSAADQRFLIGSGVTPASTMTITQFSSVSIGTTNDIRLIIPAGISMVWDSTDTTATIGGTASAKVSTTVSYEDSNKTLVVNVTSDFAAADTLTISGVSFKTFTLAAQKHLQLEVDNAGTVFAEDTQWKIIVDPSSIFFGTNF
jgi:hypothetical protein